MGALGERGFSASFPESGGGGRVEAACGGCGACGKPGRALRSRRGGTGGSAPQTQAAAAAAGQGPMGAEPPCARSGRPHGGGNPACTSTPGRPAGALPARYPAGVQPAGSRTEMVRGVHPRAGGPTRGDSPPPDNQRSYPRPLPAGVRSALRRRPTEAHSPRATRARAPSEMAAVFFSVARGGGCVCGECVRLWVWGCVGVRQPGLLRPLSGGRAPACRGCVCGRCGLYVGREHQAPRPSGSEPRGAHL